MNPILRLWLLACIAGLAFAALILAVAAQDNCRGFIQRECCCTNNCCWEVAASDVDSLPGGRWRIKSTGQVVPQKFSPDGKYYRCACDYSHERQSWIRHQGANTRCLYVPYQGS